MWRRSAPHKFLKIWKIIFEYSLVQCIPTGRPLPPPEVTQSCRYSKTLHRFRHFRFILKISFSLKIIDHRTNFLIFKKIPRANFSVADQKKMFLVAKSACLWQKLPFDCHDQLVVYLNFAKSGSA
jgi:hypothetical protein